MKTGVKGKGIHVGILVVVAVLGLAGSLSALTKGFTDWSFDDVSIPFISTSEDPIEVSSEEVEPVYHRVEAERYEIVFPLTTNGAATFGGFLFGSDGIEDIALLGSFDYDDEDLLSGGIFNLSFYIYADGFGCSESTIIYDVVQGEYGRYVISDSQAVNEPLALTVEPLYDYVLVE